MSVLLQDHDTDVFRDFVPFVQFKKREKHPWSVTSVKLLKVTLLHGFFSRSLNCTNGTKLRNASHLVKK